MKNLAGFHAKICQTAVGFLIHQDKLLLVKHKKAGMWLCPGGHVEKNELPYQTAEREFWEETGIKVEAINSGLEVKNPGLGRHSVPTPFHCNLHWVSKTNYDLRQKDPKNYQPQAPWQNGCEMHYGMSFLVKLVGQDKFKENIEETDGIGWFSEKEAIKIVTENLIRAEVKFAFEFMDQNN